MRHGVRARAARITLSHPVAFCAAKNAKENLNYKEINGKPIRIMWANRNPNARKNKDGNIFIKARLLLFCPHCCARRAHRAALRTADTL